MHFLLLPYLDFESQDLVVRLYVNIISFIFVVLFSRCIKLFFLFVWPSSADRIHRYTPDSFIAMTLWLWLLCDVFSLRLALINYLPSMALPFGVSLV